MSDKRIGFNEASQITRGVWEKTKTLVKTSIGGYSSLELRKRSGSHSAFSLMHKERPLSEDERLVLMAYRYQARGTRGHENRHQHDDDTLTRGSMWRIMCTLKPSTVWADLEVESVKGFLDAFDKPEGMPKYVNEFMLRPNNYHRNLNATDYGPQHAFAFTLYALAIIRNTAPYPNAFRRGHYLVENMRVMKVSARVLISASSSKFYESRCSIIR